MVHGHGVLLLSFVLSEACGLPRPPPTNHAEQCGVPYCQGDAWIGVIVMSRRSERGDESTGEFRLRSINAAKEHRVDCVASVSEQVAEDEENDSESGEDGEGLQHHAGADEALKALIDLKSAGRKASVQDARRQRNQIRLRALDFLDVSAHLPKHPDFWIR